MIISNCIHIKAFGSEIIRLQQILAAERLGSTNIVILCSICIKLKAPTQQERCGEKVEISDAKKKVNQGLLDHVIRELDPL